MGDARLPQCRICGNTPKNEVTFVDGMIYVLCDVDTPKDDSTVSVRAMEIDEIFNLSQDFNGRDI